MYDFLITLLLAAILFLLSFAAMAIGLLVRGRKLRGGCGTKPNDSRELDKKCCSCKSTN
ncbi:hypothetical protein ACFLS1_00215 [Verrucomicrobiota bacterium]